MYQSGYDVHFSLIWRDATKSTLVKFKIGLENNNHTLETNDCNLCIVECESTCEFRKE
jgi:hypothetical protein